MEVKKFEQGVIHCASLIKSKIKNRFYADLRSGTSTR